DRHHHVEQREGAPRRVPAPLLLPLHPLSRARDDGADRRGAFPRAEGRAGARGADDFLRHPPGPGAEEEAVDLGAARLDQAPLGRGRDPRGSAHPRPGEADPPAPRRAAPRVVTGRVSTLYEQSDLLWIYLNTQMLIAYRDGEIDTIQLAHALVPL